MSVQALKDNPQSQRAIAAWTALLWLAIAFVHLTFLRRHSLSNNEFLTLGVLDLDYGRVIQERLGRNHMPLYFLFLKWWTGIFGRGEYALRFPSQVFSLLGTFFIWRAAIHLYGKRLALLALVLAGFNQIHVQLGNDARMYSWLFCSAACSVWALVMLLDTGKRRYAFYLALAGLLGLSVQLLYLFVTSFTAIFVILKRRQLGVRYKWALAALLAPLLSLSFLIFKWGQVENKVGRSHWSPPEFSRALRQLVPMFAGVQSSFESNIPKFIAVGLAIITFILCLREILNHRRNRAAAPQWPVVSSDTFPASDPDRYLVFFWVWCVAPALLIGLAGIKSDKQFVGAWRYYTTAAAVTPLLVLAAWRILAQGSNKLWARLYASCFIVIIVVGSFGFLKSPGPGLRETAYEMAAGWQEGDRIVTSGTHKRSEAFKYYGHIDSDSADKPATTDSVEEIFPWLLKASQGAKRLWVVYYEDQKVPFAKTIKAHPELFVPRSKLHQFGETALRLFEFRPAFTTRPTTDTLDRSAQKANN